MAGPIAPGVSPAEPATSPTTATPVGTSLTSSLSPGASVPGTQVSDSTATTSTATSSTAFLSTAFLSTATPSPSSTAIGTSSGVSTGAAAGIGVGVFFAGVIVALVGAFIFAMLRKRRKPSSRNRAYPPQDSGAAIRGQQAGADIKLDEFLLESAPDADISAAVQGLGTDIDLHVDNNYHKQPVAESAGFMVDALERCSYDPVATGIPVATLQALLAQPSTRTAALRHFIGWFVFSRLSLCDVLDGSLLPPHIVAFLSAMPPPERSPESRQAFDQAFFKWRTTSAFLLHNSRTTRGPLTLNEASLSPIIGSNITLLNSVLGPFIHPTAESRAGQQENLHDIMVSGAHLGLLIFSQPTTWAFAWGLGAEGNGNGAKAGNGSGYNGSLAKQDGVKSGRIVVVPETAKISDRQGKRYDRRRVVLESESVEL